MWLFHNSLETLMYPFTGKVVSLTLPPIQLDEINWVLGVGGLSANVQCPYTIRRVRIYKFTRKRHFCVYLHLCNKNIIFNNNIAFSRLLKSFAKENYLSCNFCVDERELSLVQS